ncbi:MAG: TonB-dependent receptor [Sphingomonas sp.]|nr:TonB-dependent receptor [Sphingomonas sp.]
MKGRYRQLLLGSAMALGSVLVCSGSAIAQTGSENDTDVSDGSTAISRQNASDDAMPQDIVVTGIRRSIETAAAQKREASGILDAISSEDLGKFPDSNVAESLQRIPGVAIDRNNGEGQSVTVRGLGPSFNTVLFNGRSFASDGYNRSFSFDLIPAELISGAQVYKSSLASLQGGGIGATINIETPRPLPIGGFKAVGVGRALYEKNSGKVTPELFGLLSDTFLDNRLGILGSISYQRRIASIDYIATDGYLPNTEVGPSSAPLFTNVYAPRNQDVGNTRDSRTRLGATLVVQYEPVDGLTFTADGLYNHFKSDQETHALGSWFEPSNYTAATIDDNRSITSLTTNGNADFISSGSVRDTTTYEVGFNTEWRPSSNYSMVFDATWSRAKNSGGGKSYFTVIGTPTSYSFEAAEGSGIPSTFGYSNGALTDASLGRTHIAGVSGNNITEKVQELRWNNEWKPEFGALSAVRFGATRTLRDKTNTPYSSDPNIGCLYCGYPTLADSSLLSPFKLTGLNSGGGQVPGEYLQYNARDYFDFLTSTAATNALDSARDQPLGTTAAIFADTNGYAATAQPGTNVREVVWASYAAFDFKTRLGGMDLSATLGGRYEYTELQSSGQQLQLTDLLPVAGDPTIYTGVFANDREAVPVKQEYSYHNFLPTLNIRLNFTPTLQARFAAYRTLTRPAIGDLAPSFDYGTLRPATLTASGGNPELQPYKADNLDLSFEWYPTPTTTLSIAGFYKKVDDFIIQTFADEIITIANEGNLPVGGLIVGPNSARFSVRRPRNAESLEVKGLELNVVHVFDWLPGALSGFGIQANATFVDTNRPFDVTKTDQSFAAEGIGNSQNATIFYEKYGISARVAYNRRERFLQTLAGGPGNEPIFVRNYGQFDGSASYEITPYARLFVEGTNLFNAKYVTTGRFDNQVLSYRNTGPRYDIGMRVAF